MTNSADPDQLASEEANWSGSTLFAKVESISGFSRTRVKQCDTKNMSAYTQKMPQSQSTAFPRHQKKERWGTNKDNSETHPNETINAETEELKQSNRPGTVSRKTTGDLLDRNLTPLLQLQITDIRSVRIGVLYLICETS